MKKKKIFTISSFVFFLAFLFMFCPFQIFAADESYRAVREGKPVVSVNGANIYVSAALTVNVTNAQSTALAPIENVEAKYQNGTVYVTIKRSEINKVLKNNNFDNITTTINVYGDYLDMNKAKNYYFFSGDFDNNKYFYETYNANYMTRMFNVFEVFGNSVSLVGYDTAAHLNTNSGKILFETDELPTNYEVGGQYTYNQINFSKPAVLNVPSINLEMSLVEDEAIDLGNNKNIVSFKGGADENGNTTEITIDKVDINNFYAEYFDNNKLSYSWTMYDVDGNPIELNIDTNIGIDSSDNEEKIKSLLPSNLSDLDNRIKIISFAHEGELNGVAKVSIYVADKFKPGEILRLYYFNPIEEELEVEPIDLTAGFYDILVDEDGYVTLTLTHCSEYVLTDLSAAKIIDSVDQKSVKESKLNAKNFYLIVSIVGICILFIVLVTVCILFKNKNKK